MSNEDRITQGSCRCGQVQLKVRGRPVMTFACHCTGCQKMTASAFSLSSLYPEDAFEWSGLEPVIGGLHGDLRHFFCPHCLSWMFTRFDAMGPFVNVRSTMLDEAQATGSAPSDRAVAAAVGLSHTAVANARRRLQPYLSPLR